MIALDYADKRPLYEQTKEKLRELIISGVLKPHDKLPSVRELASNLGINPNTVKKAYDILENKGIIISKSTKGTFISENIFKAKELKIKNLINEIKDKIKELETYGYTLDDIIKELK